MYIMFRSRKYTFAIANYVTPRISKLWFGCSLNAYRPQTRWFLMLHGSWKQFLIEGRVLNINEGSRTSSSKLSWKLLYRLSCRLRFYLVQLQMNFRHDFYALLNNYFLRDGLVLSLSEIASRLFKTSLTFQ